MTGTAVDLHKLSEEISALGVKIRDLKAEGSADKDIIDAVVKELLSAKKRYAENNNGIGVDGRPYEEPLTKAQKKAKVKAEKETQPGPEKPVRIWKALLMRISREYPSGEREVCALDAGVSYLFT
jgi:hypothetical protein